MAPASARQFLHHATIGRQQGNIRSMNLSSFIWSVADLLRGKYKPHEYGRVILPFTV
jgi:type I restriction-modification system DNA methylase subunit